MIHVNAEQPDFSSIKNTFALKDRTEIFEAMNLSKDRKGSSPFYVPRNTKTNKVERKKV